MKGNITNRLFKNGSTAMILSVLVIIIILVLLLLTSDQHKNTRDASVTRANLDSFSHFDGDAGFVPASNQNSITINGTDGIVVRRNASEQDIVLSNPDTNNCAMVISIYLGDGTLLYKTGSLLPGGEEQVGSLMAELQLGFYRGALMIYDFYDVEDLERQLSRCEIQVEIQVIE